MLLDNVAVLCVPMGTCKILPPQQSRSKSLLNKGLSAVFRLWALRILGRYLGRSMSNNIGCHPTNNVKKCLFLLKKTYRRVIY